MITSLLLLLLTAIQTDSSNELSKFLSSSHIESALIPEINQAVQQSPDDAFWIGQNDAYVFSACCIPVKSKNTDVLLAQVDMTKDRLQSSLFLRKIVFDNFQQDNLQNIELLKRSLSELYGTFSFAGTAKGISWETRVSGNYIVGYAFVSLKDINAALQTPINKRKVVEKYQILLLDSLNAEWNKKNYDKVLDLWNDLESAKLYTPDSFLQAAECLVEMNKPAEAVNVLQTAYECNRDSKDPYFFKKMGALYHKMGLKAKANAAYDKTIQLLSN